ncbi:MAG: c-type cytochrome [Gammaproteobacteria bacterium]|nr:c-type cytochrome [Gammaproteobacteria bacterium]CAJ2375992.1 MAG: Cytochrome c domain-containing protein [Arenicellales bacterium IbO2]MDA7962121.1 c-type cytochrome [Gammaproteobacteria bacterium]MDA7967916.1 c-type cytochrome [Gammaproteobacteria bacterium]MDA7969658.1 c-type cytochrome [Gammaproteobacteria bacterium]
MKKATLFFAAPLAAVAALFLFAAAQVAAKHNTPESLDARTAPVGQINVAESGAATGGVTVAASRGRQSGEAVYERTCAVCHASGIAGAPRTGDREAWRARLAQGMAVLLEHAINGFQGETGVMLPRGGNTALSDAEVEAAVVYMVELSR